MDLWRKTGKWLKIRKSWWCSVSSECRILVQQWGRRVVFFSALHSLCWLDSHLKVNNLILPVHVENNGFSLWETDHLGVTSLKYYRESMPWRTAWSTASPLRTWRDGEWEACALRLSVLITEVNCGVIMRGRKAMRGEIPKNRRQVEIALFFPRAFERNIFMWLEI